MFEHFIFPITVGFLSSIKAYAESNGLIPIFVSREGHRLFPLYKSYYGECHYLYYSRRAASSLNFSANRFTIEEFKNSLILHRFEGDFYSFVSQRLPLSPSNSSFEIGENKFLDTRIEADFNYVLDFVSKNFDLINISSASQLKNFNLSISNLPDIRKWLLVDLGVFGTVQNSISLLKQFDVEAFYLCGSDANPLNNKKYNYLLSYEDSTYRQWSAWLECIFNAPYGTVVGFDNIGAPIFGRPGRASENFDLISESFNKINLYISSNKGRTASTLIEYALGFINEISTYERPSKELDEMFYLENDFVRPNQADKNIKIILS